VVDCEKDWWDMLEWDNSDANHDPSLFETRHPAHYKKTLPRVSVLRYVSTCILFYAYIDELSKLVPLIYCFLDD
jgi:hypothetical protein